MFNAFATPWTIAHQVPLSMGFPKQEYGSGLPFSFPGDLPNPGIEPVPPALAGGFFTTEPSGKSQVALGLRCRVLAFSSWGDGASHCGGSSCGRAWTPGHVGPAMAHTGSLPQGMWSHPRAGFEPVSSALAGRCLTTGPPEKSLFLPFWLL